MRITILLSGLLWTGLLSAQHIQRLWQQKDYEAIYAQRDRVDRMSGRDMLRVAQAAQHFGEDSVAIDILDLAIDKGYADDQTYYQKGICLSRQNLHLAAAGAFHQALALNPNRLPYMLAKADAYYQGDEPDSALAVFERVYTMFPDRDVAAYMCCRIQEEQGYVNNAIACYKEHIPGIREKGYRLEALENLAILQWKAGKDSTGAEVSLLRLIDEAPDNVQFRLLTIQFYAETGRWNDVNEQRREVHRLRDEGKLPPHIVRKNVLPMVEFAGDDYVVQVYEIIDPERSPGGIFEAFFVTPNHARPMGRWIYREEGNSSQLVGEGMDEEVITLEGTLTLQEFVERMKHIESKRP